MRLDKEIVLRGLAPTRAKAQELIKDRKVKINGLIETKQAYPVNDIDDIQILPNDTLKYVSRGGLKLEGAISYFDLDFKDKIVMDIGSSTGGFTDCALQHGAKRVIGIDVGTDVMVPELRIDPRVDLHENLNLKDIDKSLFKNVDIVVTDVSFISLKYVIDKVLEQDRKYDLVFLIKPQFECGKVIADKYKGIINDKEIHTKIITNISKYLEKNGYYTHGLAKSPIKGGDGNIEYLIYARPFKSDKSFNFEEIVEKAFRWSFKCIID